MSINNEKHDQSQSNVIPFTATKPAGGRDALDWLNQLRATAEAVRERKLVEERRAWHNEWPWVEVPEPRKLNEGTAQIILERLDHELGDAPMEAGQPYVIRCTNCGTKALGVMARASSSGIRVHAHCRACETISGTYEYGIQSEPDELHSIPAIDFWDWDDVPVPEQEWTVDGRIPKGYVTLFSGEGAGGKSLIELQRAVCHALGVNWLGANVERGPALVIECEDDEPVIHKRLADILKHHGKRFADVRGMLHVCTLAGENAVLAAFDHKSGTVVPTARYWELENMVAKIKPVSISILASADVFAGNEIDRSQVQQFIALLTHLAMIGESGLVLVSHPSLTGISSDSGLSGSTQWHNSVRARYYIKHVKPKNGEDFDANLRVIEFKKNNYGAISESIPLRYEDGLFVSVAQSTADQVARDAGAQVVFLAQLTKLTDQGFDLGPNKKSPSNYAPAVIAAQIGAGDYRQDEFERAMHYLLDVDKIHIAKARRDGKGRKYLRPGPKPDSDAE